MSLPVIGFMCFLMVGSTLFHRNCDTSSLTSIFQDTMIDVALKCMITCSSESRMDIAIIISIQIYPVGVINPATFLPARYFCRFGEREFIIKLSESLVDNDPGLTFEVVTADED